MFKSNYLGNHLLRLKPPRLLNIAINPIGKRVYLLPTQARLDQTRYESRRTYFVTAVNRCKDSKHFFTDPRKDVEHNKLPLGGLNDTDVEIGKAIQQLKTRKRKIIIWFTVSSIVGLLIGYKVIYKVMYKKKESYIPLVPCRKIHELSPSEEEKLNIKQMQDFVMIKIMEKLTSHDFIKEHYSVPLQIVDDIKNNGGFDDKNNKNKDEKMKFKIWCEDEDPVVYGILMKPNDNVQIDSNGKKWRRIPFLFKWRLSHQSINIKYFVQNFLDNIGIKYDRLISPESIYDTFKFEYPIPNNNLVNEHSMHICFSGEFNLDKDSTIIFVGKYHVEVKFEEINLLRRENDELVKYILFKKY